MNSIVRILILLVGLFSATLFAQENLQTSGKLSAKYQAMFNDSSASSFKISPDQNWLVIATRTRYKDYQSTVSSNYFKAVGKSLNTNLAIEENSAEYTELLLLDINTQKQIKIAKEGATFVDFKWSPNSKKLALAVKQNNKITLWKYELADNQLTQWLDIPLSVQLSRLTTVWLPDSESVIVRKSLLNQQSLSKQSQSQLKQGKEQSDYEPVVKNSGNVEVGRVYRDLLDTPEKQNKFKQLLTQQAVLVEESESKAAAKTRTLSSPSMLERLRVSPDGKYLLTVQLDENLEGNTKFSRLARRYQVIDIATGKVVMSPATLEVARNKAKIKDSEPYGSRSVQWQPNQAATLTWVEAKSDKGVVDSDKIIDAIYALPAPFDAEPELLAGTNWRVFDYYWTKLGRLISIEWKYAEKQIRLWSYTKAQPKVLLEQYNYRNKYQDPGDIDAETTPLGNKVATSYDDNSIYLFGQGRTKQGQKPFITSYAENGEKDNLFTSSEELLERPAYVLKDKKLVVISEASMKPQVLNIIDQNKEYVSLYDWQNANSAYVKQKPLTLSFERADGLAMSTDVFLPELAENKKVPAVIWLYPRETTFERGQQRNSLAQNFIPIQPNSYFTSLLEGVAVVDMSSFPIVKPEQGEANDTFIEQQIMNSEALVRALESTGKIDTSKLMLMGHSYGAFSALNLLAYTDLFSAGIVKSGAYNRTLTPLGFQQEKRNLWQAPELYQKMSPLFQADKIKEPVLLIHGSSDQNPGTSPLQSEMMFQALQANKGTARLVLLPGDGHSYQIKENLQLMLQHQSDWIQQYLF